jgi:hypothetical protein
VESFKAHGHSFVQQVSEDPKRLEDISGITALVKVVDDAADKNAYDDEEDDF